MTISYPLPHTDPGHGNVPAPEVGAELAALARVGCTVTFSPCSDGMTCAEVLVVGPTWFDAPVSDELNAVARGESPKRPLLYRWRGVGDYGLALWLRSARAMFERKRN